MALPNEYSICNKWLVICHRFVFVCQLTWYMTRNKATDVHSFTVESFNRTSAAGNKIASGRHQERGALSLWKSKTKHVIDDGSYLRSCEVCVAAYYTKVMIILFLLCLCLQGDKVGRRSSLDTTFTNPTRIYCTFFSHAEPDEFED
jgi:hypothetical protein